MNREIGDKLYCIKQGNMYYDLWAKDADAAVQKYTDMGHKLVGFWTVYRVTNVQEYKG